MKHGFFKTESKSTLFCLVLMALLGLPSLTSVQTIPALQTLKTPLEETNGSFTIEQTLSDGAQRTTIAFDGLAFLTGSLGADSFFPPGKVADFWGYQYLRDNDPSEMGHNTDFLTKASLNMLYVLTSAQRAQLITLANSQVASINEYGYKRFVFMKAFRCLLEGDIPTGTTGLSKTAVMTYAGDLFSWYAGSIDADVYFYPERQGTYFGSFYMKDAPAVGNPNYTIDPNLTANMGNAFLATLTSTQAQLVTDLVTIQKPSLYAIVKRHRDIATQLRKFIAGQTADQATVLSLAGTYGELDGEIVYNFATNFAAVNKTLSASQKHN